MFGLPSPHGGHLINEIGHMVQAGRSIRPEVVADDAARRGRLVAFRPARETWYRPLFGYATWFTRQPPLPVAQVVWADPEGRFPWDEEADPDLAANQLLALGAARRAPGLRLVESWSRRLGVSGSDPTRRHSRRSEWWREPQSCTWLTTRTISGSSLIQWPGSKPMSGSAISRISSTEIQRWRRLAICRSAGRPQGDRGRSLDSIAHACVRQRSARDCATATVAVE